MRNELTREIYMQEFLQQIFFPISQILAHKLVLPDILLDYLLDTTEKNINPLTINFPKKGNELSNDVMYAGSAYFLVEEL